MRSWYDRAFGPWYLKLYPHRDLPEARTAVDTLASWIPARGTVLDVGCGPGRYLDALGQSGRRVLGLDLSWALLEEAAKLPGLDSRLVRGDMRRLPFAGGVFSTAISMFTSFGYFGSQEAHVELLSEISRVVRPRGRLILDYLNAPVVRNNLVPESRRVVEGYEVYEKRFVRADSGGEWVVKELVIQDSDGAEVERYHEEVSLYERDELLSLLKQSEWREIQSLGDYSGAPWSPDSSRLMVVAEKEH